MKNMNPLICLGLIGVAVLAGGCTLAQTASAPASAQAAGASVPGMSPASAASPPQGVPRYGEFDTPGWPMMSKEERAEYAAAMAQFKSRGECVTYMNKHFEEMRKRSLQRNLPLQGTSRSDLCNVLPI
jgi:hypothetical protein